MNLNNRYLKILIWLVAVFGMIYTFLFSWFLIIEPKNYKTITIEVKSINNDTLNVDTTLINECDTLILPLN